MSETETLLMTSNAPDTSNVFYLAKPKKSIFIGLEMREYPSFEKIYGFIANKMGYKLRKKKLVVYRDEHLLYKKYIRKMKWIEDLQFISVQYYQKEHGWGRSFANEMLSLSLFPRRSRHSFCEIDYFDADIQNCQPDCLYQKGIQFGFTDADGLDGLREYCEDPKKCRQDIINHYCLTDIINEDGSIKRAKDQAKELTFRLAFGGGIYTWKQEFQVKRVDDLPMIKKMENILGKIAQAINLANPHIRADLETDEKFQMKSEAEKLRAITSTYTQTLERLIQEECVAYLVKNYSSVKLIDIIPSQDGMMLLKRQLEGINLELLLLQFNELIKKKFNLNIKWTIKPFDEAVPINPCKKMPIDVFYEDLEKGERYIAELIYPAFKNDVKFYQNNKLEVWYNLEKDGLWEENNSAPITKIISQLQEYIDEEVLRCWNEWKAELNEDKKKALQKKEMAVRKHYKNVGSPSFAKMLCVYLKSYLKDNLFVKKLNKTAGKFPFKDGMLDLKTGIFRKGFRYDDYITFTTQVEYLALNPTAEKMDYVKTKFQEITNNQASHLDYYLSALGYSLTGDASKEKAIWFIEDGTELKEGDNGKTFVFGLLMKIFPEYVQQTNIQAIEENYAKSHKNIAKWKNARIVLADEGTKKNINASLIKKIGDGDVIDYEVMFGTTELLDVMFKFFICSNHKFKVREGEDAVFNRLRQIVCGSHFDRTGERLVAEPDKLLFIADKDLPDTLLTNYRDEIVRLMMDYAIRYYQQGLPPIPAEFVKATMETKMANNPFAVWFNERFEVKDKSKVSVDKILGMGFTSSREEVLKNLKKIGIKYNKDLSFDEKKMVDGVEKYIKGGIEGWSVKVDND